MGRGSLDLHRTVRRWPDATRGLVLMARQHREASDRAGHPGDQGDGQPARRAGGGGLRSPGASESHCRRSKQFARLRCRAFRNGHELHVMPMGMRRFTADAVSFHVKNRADLFLALAPCEAVNAARPRAAGTKVRLRNGLFVLAAAVCSGTIFRLLREDFLSRPDFMLP
jgi:hypothetical protein